MSKYEFLQPRFTEGVLAKSLQGRSSEEFYSYGYKASKNMIPMVSGPIVKRPGTNYIGEALNSTSRFIPFFKDQNNTYILEISLVSSSCTIRVWSQDQLLNAHGATTPYSITTSVWTTQEHLDSLKTTQSGDIIFVCCPLIPPQKISRTLASSGTRASDDSVWAISEFVMEDGPYNAVNVYSEITGKKGYSLKLNAEPDISKSVSVGDDSGIKFTATNHGISEGDVVVFGGSTMPGNVSKTDEYYAITVTANTFKISTTKGGTAVAHTSNGSAVVAYSGLIPVAEVEFNTINNSIILANHGLQSGMKVRLQGDWGYLRSEKSHDTTNKLADADYYVISSEATSFQVSTTDGGSALEFELQETSATDTAKVSKSDANVTLYRYAYKVNSSVRFNIYNQKQTDDHTVAQGLLSSTTDKSDIGRLIRINPLSKPGENIGGIRWAWGVITAVGDGASPPTVDVTMKTELSGTRGTYGTPEFRLGAFSDSQGWPQVSQIYQQRMVLAANTFQPSTIWLSRTGDFYSFAPTELLDQDSPAAIVDGMAVEVITDSNGLTFTLDSDTLDAIKWLGESKKLAMGTSAGVYMLYGSETNLVVTPFRFTINRETSFSATDTAPIVISNALIYPQIGGKNLQMLSLDKGVGGQWDASKISLKGYDIIKSSEITKMIWQERPNGIIWCLMADGRLLSLSFDLRLEFMAWSEHVIGGTDTKVLDIEMIPRSSHDQLWLKVSRTIDGDTEYYMETLGRFPSEGALDRNDYIFSDSAITKTIAGTFTASTHLGKILFTSTKHGLIDTQKVRFTSSGTPVDLPANLEINTDYYVRDKADDTFKVATTSGGTAIAFSDAGSGTHSWSTDTVFGLDHLEADEVQIYNDGMQHINKIVASNGSVTLNHFEGSRIVSGLPYLAELDTLEPPAPENQFSYSKRLIKIAVIIEDSLGIQLDYNDLSEELLFRTMADAMGRQIPLFSGTRKLSLSGIGWDVHTVKISSNGPLPMQLNAIIIEAETGGS